VIRRREGEEWVLVRQPAHAALAADLGAACAIESRGPAEAFALAVRHHDDGWVDRDAEIREGPDGGPETFLDLTLLEHLAVARRSVARAMALDPYAGVLVARYSAWLHGGRTVDDADAAATRDRTIAAWEELARALVADGVSATDLAYDLELLGLLDRIALWLCGWPETPTLEVAAPDGATLAFGVDGERVRVARGLLREPVTLELSEQTTGLTPPYDVRARRTRTITLVIADA
jgi:hypothetical protein